MTWQARAIWFLIGFAVCLLSLILIPFKFNPEFNAIDTLGLIATVFIAILIQYYGTQQYSDFRAAKNYLDEHVKMISSQVQNAHKLFMECYIDQEISDKSKREILSFKRDLNNNIYLLEQALSECKIQSTHFNKVELLRSNYNDVLTGDPFPSRPYDARSFSVENKIHRELAQTLLSLRFEINGK